MLGQCSESAGPEAKSQSILVHPHTSPRPWYLKQILKRKWELDKVKKERRLLQVEGTRFIKPRLCMEHLVWASCWWQQRSIVAGMGDEAEWDVEAK